MSNINDNLGSIQWVHGGIRCRVAVRVVITIQRPVEGD